MGVHDGPNEVGRRQVVVHLDVVSDEFGGGVRHAVADHSYLSATPRTVILRPKEPFRAPRAEVVPARLVHPPFTVQVFQGIDQALRRSTLGEPLAARELADVEHWHASLVRGWLPRHPLIGVAVRRQVLKVGHPQLTFTPITERRPIRQCGAAHRGGGGILRV